MDWLLRFIKGMFIGSGFILPGISGGALAAVFGIYEPLIAFLAHPFKKLKENFSFFLPIALGGLAGIYLLSFAVSFLLGTYQTIILWFFVGAIVGTAPSLWKQAGKEGRNKKDYWIMSITFVLALLFLIYGKHLFSTSIPQNTWTWMLAGGLIALGIIVPGLSPSNFLLYMGMYKAMSDHIKGLDFSVLIPIAIGGLLVLILLSKLFDHIFKVAYSQLFHFILGVVAASTIMIIPLDYQGFSFMGYFMCAVLLGLGILVGYFMACLEDKVVPEG